MFNQVSQNMGEMVIMVFLRHIAAHQLLYSPQLHLTQKGFAWYLWSIVVQNINNIVNILLCWRGFVLIKERNSLYREQQTTTPGRRGRVPITGDCQDGVG